MIEPDINEVSAEDGELRVVLEYLDEGNDGYYNSEDPNDEPLLRLSVYRRDGTGGWTAIEDASYCTAIPATLPTPVLQAMANYLLGMMYGESDYAIEKMSEGLSWLNQDDCLTAARVAGVEVE